MQTVMGRAPVIINQCVRRRVGAEIVISTQQRTVLAAAAGAKFKTVPAERERRRPVPIFYIGLDGRRGAAPRVGLAFFGLVI